MTAAADLLPGLDWPEQVPADTEICYMLCFRDPETGQPKRYEHAGHYLGTTTAGRLDEHVTEHRQGRAAVLTAVARAAGLDFKVTRTWAGGHAKERQLKTRSGAAYCPDCAPRPQPGTTPPQPGAEYLTRRQREARALAVNAAERERMPLWEIERTAVPAEPHECQPGCTCALVDAAVTRFLQEIGAEPRKDTQMTEDAESNRLAADFARERAQAWRREGYDEEADYWQEVAENHTRQAEGLSRQTREPGGSFRQEAFLDGDPAQLRETIRDWMADLPAEGREFLREALEDAIEYREPGDYCADCGPDELCIDHAEDLERADAYRERLEMLQADIEGDYQPEPLPRQLGPAEAADALAPLAAELPDGTPHFDPVLADRGWQAHGGIYTRQPQAQMEAG